VFFHVVEGFWLDGGGVSDDGLGARVDFQDRAAAGAGDFEGWRILRHLSGMILQN